MIHKEDLGDVPIKGFEEYPDDTPGKMGYFVPYDGSELLEIIQLSTPDCYEVSGSKGYLLVPDLKTSEYLRSKGPSFQCRCKKYDDEFWSITENIPEVEVNAY